MLTPMLAEMSGSIHVGLAGLGSAIGVGLVGMKASEAVGRNPGAFGKVIVLAVLGMALSEPDSAPRRALTKWIYEPVYFVGKHRQRPGPNRP